MAMSAQDLGLYSLLLALLYLGAALGIIGALVFGVLSWVEFAEPDHAVSLCWPLLGTGAALVTVGCMWLARRLARRRGEVQHE